MDTAAGEDDDAIAKRDDRHRSCVPPIALLVAAGRFGGDEEREFDSSVQIKTITGALGRSTPSPAGLFREALLRGRHDVREMIEVHRGGAKEPASIGPIGLRPSSTPYRPIL